MDRSRDLSQHGLDSMFAELTELRPDEVDKVVGSGGASPLHGSYADG